MQAEVLLKRKMHFTCCASADCIPARSLQRTKPLLSLAPIVRGRAGGASASECRCTRSISGRGLGSRDPLPPLCRSGWSLAGTHPMPDAPWVLAVGRRPG